MSRPATEVSTWWETPSVEAWARWALPKASLTKTEAPLSAMRRAAKAGSLASSSAWKRTFSSKSTPPSARSPAIFRTWGPTQSAAIITGRPRSSASRAPTGLRLSSGSGPLGGRPKWEARISRAPALIRWSRVGCEARIRVSSRMAPLAIGTLKSTRTKTRSPRRFRRSLTVCFGIRNPPRGRVPSGVVAGSHEVQQVLQAIREAPLVVVPGKDFGQVAVHDLGEGGVHDGGGGVAPEVHRNQLLVGDLQNPLHGPRAPLLASGVDFFGRGGP